MGIRSVSGWCEVDGCRIAWEEIPCADKEAQPLLCLHDVGAGSREFLPIIDRCPPGSRLIMMDWPGHGRSGELAHASGEDAPELTVEHCAAIIRALLNELGIAKPILLGSGFGAAAAIRFVADNPDRALGLVLCQPAGVIAARGSSPFSQRGKRGVRRLLSRMKKFAPGKSGNRVEIAARRQALRMAALRPAMQSARAGASASAERSRAGLRLALESLSCPALFVLSRDSLEYPLRRYLALLDPSLAWAPQHRYTVFAGAFHPFWDEPDRFGHALTSFVEAQLPVEKHSHAWLLTAADWPTQNNNLWKCVHPDCAAELVLPAGLDANEPAGRKYGFDRL